MDNEIQKGNVITVTFSEDVESGQPYKIGNITGVVIGSYSAGEPGGLKRVGVFDLSVQGVDDAGNSAVAYGDIIYISNTYVLSKNDTGTEFGKAMGAVVSGQTTSIPVLLK